MHEDDGAPLALAAQVGELLAVHGDLLIVHADASWLNDLAVGRDRNFNYRKETISMAVSVFQDYPLADRDREWDGAAAEERIRRWAGAETEPNEKYRDAHVWYDHENQDNFTAYRLIIADVIDGKVRAVPTGILTAASITEGARGGADLPGHDIDRVRGHLARYYAKMGERAPWDRD